MNERSERSSGTTAAGGACAPRRSPRTEAAILEATVALLAEQGVGGLTIDGVAARAGVGKATIYRHWSSKNALVMESTASLTRHPEPPDTGCVRDDLVIMLDGLRRSISTPPLAGLLVSLVDAAERDPELAELHTSFATERRSKLLSVLQRGVDRGQLPPDLDCDLAADLLVGPLFYRRLVSRREVDAELLERAVDTVLAGVTSPACRHR